MTGDLDPEITDYLQNALEAEDLDEAQYHIREALQLIEVEED